MPVLVIAGTLAVVAILGFGSSTGASKDQIRQEVSALLTDIPQDGRTLGSPRAPITLSMFADLECPTVKRFVEAYLPSIIETWVRDGTMRIEYRSLQTDTSDERMFFEQEAAALAAGRQDRMWNFLLSFLYQQKDDPSGYATEGFLSDIAAQVPSLEMEPWRRNRLDPLLFRQVALGVHTAQVTGMSSTPSFVVGLTDGKLSGSEDSGGVLATKEEIESSLSKEIRALGEENLGDAPTLSPSLGGSKGANPE